MEAVAAMDGNVGASMGVVLEFAIWCAVVVVVVARWLSPASTREINPIAMVSSWLYGPVHPDDEARLPDLRHKVEELRRSGSNTLDLRDVPLRALPGRELAPIAGCCTHIILTADASGLRLDPLRRWTPLLVSVTVSGSAVVAQEWLDALAALPHLRELDLSGCRVKDTNNSAMGLCSGLDLYEFCHGGAGERLQRFGVPALAAVRVGTVAKVYPRAGVAVVQITRPIRVGDVIELRRVEHTFAGGVSAHHWSSQPSVLDSIRDSANNQLDVAVPAPQESHAINDVDEDMDNGDVGNDGGGGNVDDVASQFAVKLPEVGKKGDSVYWCGFGGTHADATS